MFDITRISIHFQIWLCVCKSSSGHEDQIASWSVHGCGGGASRGAGGVDADFFFGDITIFEIFYLGGEIDNVQIFSTLRCAYIHAKRGNFFSRGDIVETMVVVLVVTSPFCKCSHRNGNKSKKKNTATINSTKAILGFRNLRHVLTGGGVCHNDQIFVTFRCAYNPQSEENFFFSRGYCSNNCGGPNSHFTTLQMFSQERVFDNVQISTTFRYVFLLVSLRQQVLLGGMFDITRISIHCHIWQCICKSSSGHEG